MAPACASFIYNLVRSLIRLVRRARLHSLFFACCPFGWQLPYAQATFGSSEGLSTVRTNTEVAALRDQYHADLVVLVGNFPDTCGLG